MWGWIILGIIVFLIICILSIKAVFIVSYDEKLISKIKILFFEKEFDLFKVIESVIFPPQKQEKPAEKKSAEKTKKNAKQGKADPMQYIKNIYKKDGVAGIIEFIQTLCDSLTDGAGVFFRHFIIHKLNVDIIVAKGDAAETGREYGRVIGAYYPFIGVIRNGMKVSNYSENIRADFLANEGKSTFYFKGSINVKNLLGIVLVAAKTFLVNLKNSK